MKKILIGTHNKGKFKEIAYLISKKYKKNSPFLHKIPSPKETSKTFSGNSKLKANFFSKFVNYPVISDDSGLCIKSLKNKPGIYSARLAKKQGSFFKAMNYILKKMKNNPTQNEKIAKNKTNEGVFKFTAKKVPANTPRTINKPKVFTISKLTALCSMWVFVEIIDVGIIIAREVPTDKCILVKISNSSTLNA